LHGHWQYWRGVKGVHRIRIFGPGGIGRGHAALLGAYLIICRRLAGPCWIGISSLSPCFISYGTTTTFILIALLADLVQFRPTHRRTLSSTSIRFSTFIRISCSIYLFPPVACSLLSKPLFSRSLGAASPFSLCSTRQSGKPFGDGEGSGPVCLLVVRSLGKEVCQKQCRRPPSGRDEGAGQFNSTRLVMSSHLYFLALSLFVPAIAGDREPAEGECIDTPRGKLNTDHSLKWQAGNLLCVKMLGMPFNPGVTDGF